MIFNMPLPHFDKVLTLVGEREKITFPSGLGTIFYCITGCSFVVCAIVAIWILVLTIRKKEKRVKKLVALALIAILPFVLWTIYFINPFGQFGQYGD